MSLLHPNLCSAHRRSAHEGDEPHFHEWSEAERHAVAEAIWKAENVELTTVGIDIGSSTSHLMFSKVHLQRKTQLLSSQFVVVSREVLWRSPVVFTPFLPDFTIDAERLRAFIEESYRAAGLSPAQIDSGAVILTGEAIRRKNAPGARRQAASGDLHRRRIRVHFPARERRTTGFRRTCIHSFSRKGSVIRRI